MPARRLKRTTGPAPAPPGRRRGPLLAVGLGFVLTAGAAWSVVGLWHRLPASQYRSIRAAAVEAARTNPTGVAREGLVLLVNSNQFTAAWQGRRSIAETREEVRSRLVDLPHTQVGRLQLVALTLLEAERRGEPIERTWPAVRPLLSGVERAPLPHFFNEALAREQQAYQRVGLSPAVAWGAAQASLGTPHGPFLQYFVQRMTLLSDALGATGDTAASQMCRRGVRRLLRQWVLDPGPPSLRLPAADLLATELGAFTDLRGREGEAPAEPRRGAERTARQEPRPPYLPDGSPETREDQGLERATHTAGSVESVIAAKCRQWHREYHDRTLSAPTPPPLLRITDDPPPPPNWGHLDWQLPVLGWTVAATVVFMLAALICSAVSRFMGLPAPHAARATVVGIVGALITVGIAWSVSAGLRGTVLEDLRRIGPPRIAVPRLPLVAAGVAVAATAGAAVIAGRGLASRRQRWVGAVAAVGRTAWPVAAVAVLGMCWINLHMHVFLERPYMTGPEAALAWFADPNAHGLLDDLRVWDP